MTATPRIDRLVVLGSTVTALAVVRDAARLGVDPLVVDTADGPALHSRYATAIRLPTADIDTLKALATPSTALIATADHWLRFVVQHRVRLDSGFALVAHPANASLELCLDKTSFLIWCRANGLPVAKSWLLPDAHTITAADYPLLLRPAVTRHDEHDGARRVPKAVEAQRPAELATWLATYAAAGVAPLISQSLLGRRLEQVSVGFAARGASWAALSARKLRPAPARCAVGSCVETIVDPASEALAQRAAHALNYVGVGELEILRDLDSDERFVIELNARPWLQYALAPAAGVPLLETVLANVPSASEPRAPRPRRWVNVHDDLFNAFSRSVGEVRGGSTTLARYLASLGGSNVFALFDVRDPWPALRHLIARSSPRRAA